MVSYARLGGVVDLDVDVATTIEISTTITISTIKNELMRSYVILGGFVDLDIDVAITRFDGPGCALDLEKNKFCGFGR